MSLEVRPVNLETELEQLVRVLQRNLPDIPHAVRTKWLYHKHPCGKPKAWFLIDRAADCIVGVTSLFPRLLWIADRFVESGQVGDFAVDKSYRTLGPALMLQKATLEAVETGHFAICYDCPPHALGMSTFKRLGMQENCNMHRFVRLIRTDRQVRKIVGDGSAARMMSPVANAILSAFNGPVRDTRDIEIRRNTTRFGEEFTDLDRSLTNGGIRSRRWAEDLNWRFREDPVHDYITITARRNRQLLGFAVFTLHADDATLIDVSGEARVASLLIQGVIQEVSGAGVQTLQAIISASNPLSHVLRKCGFRFTSAQARVVAYTSKAESELQMKLMSPENWAFTHADIMA